ncbi:Peptidase M48 [Corchorus olitorius]|uniref:Peptidase M48 n=1 Tax=Corchorus olitorius TaxID=93759 RepID=A0A1R3KRN8_9ROSI|nr:Peptidase M48 [Corchorus olitorius]
MVFSYIKSKSKPILFYASSASFRADRVSLGLLQNLTSKFKPQWLQSPLLSRTSFTRFNVVSIATVAGGAARRLSYPRGGFAQATSRFYHSNRNLPRQISKSTFQGQLVGSAVLLDKDKIINASCGPNGKIVINSGYLKHLKSDEEIAAVLAHEMGHAVARHVAEGMLRRLVLLLLTFVGLGALDVIFKLRHTLPAILVDNFFSRRREAEADYIGLMLMASAGYDPQVAPNLYENKIPLMFPEIPPNVFEDLEYWLSFVASHPPCKKRAKLLKEPKTMELAKQVYEDVKARNHITCFV